MPFKETTFNPNNFDDGVEPSEKSVGSENPMPPKKSQVEHIRDASIGNLGLSGDALAAKKKLDAEPKYPCFIPFDPGESGKAYRAITINGYRMEIRKNVMVEVPKSVAELVRDSYNMEDAVQHNHTLNLANRDKAAKDALA